MDTLLTTGPNERIESNRLAEMFEEWSHSGGTQRFSKTDILQNYEHLITVVTELLIGFRHPKPHEDLELYEQAKTEFENDRLDLLEGLVACDDWFEIDDDNRGEDGCNRIALSFQPVRIIADFYGVDIGELP